jgi:hypothetical protein
MMLRESHLTSLREGTAGGPSNEPQIWEKRSPRRDAGLKIKFFCQGAP